MIGQLRVDAPQDLLIESLHVFSPEGWLQSDGLIEDTAQGPDVAFMIVGLVPPYLGTSIVGCAGLSVEEALFGHL